MPRALIAGNWKMNGLRRSGLDLARTLASRYAAAEAPGFDMVVCPPFTLLEVVGSALGASGVSLGAQDCHSAEKGAHTGDVSAEMLADTTCEYVIVGHSERRQGHGEIDLAISEKAAAAHRAGLVTIVCVGETEAERDARRAYEVVSRQLAGSLPPGASAENTVIAYEPVWAIGTGRTPSPEDVAEMHRHIRAELGPRMEGAAETRLLYGGSVKPENAEDLLTVPNVDGALVGGASLNADDFWTIAMARG